MQERNKKLFSSSFLSLLFSLSLTFSPIYSSQFPTHPSSPTDSSLILLCLFFFLSYCIGTVSLFLSLSLFNHKSLYAGIKLSVAHHFSAMSGLSPFSFPHCCFHSCLLQHISPCASQRLQGTGEEKHRQGHGNVHFNTSEGKQAQTEKTKHENTENTCTALDVAAPGACTALKDSSHLTLIMAVPHAYLDE